MISRITPPPSAVAKRERDNPKQVEIAHRRNRSALNRERQRADEIDAA